jgi:Ca2+-binding RTX toxin-like protein
MPRRTSLGQPRAGGQGDDGAFDDGQSNEDRVFPDVEQVTGTQFDDVIFVPNQQASGRVPHGLLTGANGNDQLLGSPFADTLNGGAGQDVLHAGTGDDLLEGRENAMAGQTVARDDLRCGGGIDTAVMDLLDVQSGVRATAVGPDSNGRPKTTTRRLTLR